MFLVTVSTVLIVENGVLMIHDGGRWSEDGSDVISVAYRFPTTTVRAGQESVQFAALRSVKEEFDLFFSKELLIPVDFRSDPDRSDGGNVMDIGFVCITEDISPDDMIKSSDGGIGCHKWLEIDFETKKLMNPDKPVSFHMDHELLLERAIDVALMVKE
jgi:ADP-ribose pyrophosphatase YjhB (NUDIX family)